MQTLRLFCDVARMRSFSRAAESHGVTQSAASQRISQLEKKLGVTLIDRSVRPLQLTPPGELFLRESQELVDRYDRMEQRVQAAAGGISSLEGHVTVASIYSAGIGLLNSVKERFERAYPRIGLSLDYKRPDDVHDAVVENRCDLGIVSYPQKWRDVSHLPLRDETMAVVVNPDHPLAGHTSVSPEHLDGLRMAAFERDLPVARQIRQYLRDHGVRCEVSAEFDNIDTIRGAVEVTDVFAILPKRTVLREAAVGRLVTVELQPRLVRPVGIIYRKRRGSNGHNGKHGKDEGSSQIAALPSAAQRFVDFLLEHAGPRVDTIDELEACGRQTVAT